MVACRKAKWTDVTAVVARWQSGQPAPKPDERIPVKTETGIPQFID